MSEPVRNYWLEAVVKIAEAIKQGRIRATTYDELLKEEGFASQSLNSFKRYWNL